MADASAPSVNAASVAGRLRTGAWIAAGLMALAGGALAAWMALRPVPPAVLRIAAGPAGSDAYQLLQETGEVARRHAKSVTLAVRATRDPSESIALLNAGAADLAVIRADTPVVSGVEIIARLFPDYFMLIVRRGAGIFAFDDLPGKRIILPPAGSDGYRSFFAVLDHHDLSAEQFSWKSDTLEQARRALLGGTVDAIFTVRSLRDPVLMRMFDDAELKNLPLDVIDIPQATALAMKRPLLSAGSIPQGALSGALPAPSRAVTAVAVDRILVARSDVDAPAVRALTEVLFENRLDLTMRIPLAASISRPDSGNGLSIPLHAGAAAYFTRDEPGFVERNSNAIGLLLTLAAMIGSGLLALRSWFLAGQKNKVDLFNHRLAALNQRALETADAADLAAIRTELAAMLADVVAALDTDEVTDEGFHSFSRILDTVTSTVRDREAALLRA